MNEDYSGGMQGVSSYPYPYPQGGAITESVSAVSEDFMKFKLSTEETIENILHYMRGQVYDFKKKEYVQKFERMANEEFINDLAAILYAYIDKNIILARLSKDDINRIARDIRIKIATLIYLYYDKYEIKEEHRGLIIRMIDPQIYATLTRALEGKENESIGRSVHRVEESYQYPERGGVFSILPFKRKY